MARCRLQLWQVAHTLVLSVVNVCLAMAAQLTGALDAALDRIALAHSELKKVNTGNGVNENVKQLAGFLFKTNNYDVSYILTRLEGMLKLRERISSHITIDEVPKENVVSANVLSYHNLRGKTKLTLGLIGLSM